MRVVVTGGAGFIGSHVVHALRCAGHEPYVLDDLSNGHADAIGPVPFEVGDVTSRGVLSRLVERVQAQAILHCAALIQVAESVASPDRYYRTNVGGTLRVVEAATQAKIPVVLSSTAAVYGEPERLPIPIDHPCRPENPYGWSHLIGERILGDCARAGGFPHAVLRYFNAAGAEVEARLRERHSPETHLVPLAIEAAQKSGRVLKIYGSDWPTRDGTCLRDYVHVVDLAEAHLRVLDRLVGGASAITVNLGQGQGTTVREVIDAVSREVGRPVRVELSPRRAGDVASLVADVSEAERLLGWKPRRSSIERIVKDAVAVLR